MYTIRHSAKYLTNAVHDEHTARVSILAEITTEVHELSMNHHANVQYPNVFEDYPDATHVVVRIVYGGGFVISFEKAFDQLSHSLLDDKRVITQKLKAEVFGMVLICVF